LVIREKIRLLTNCLALPCSIAVWDTCEMNIGIGVGPCKINEGSAAETAISTIFL